MDVKANDYVARAKDIIQNKPEMRTAVTGATLAFEENRVASFKEVDAEAWRDWAARVKTHLLANLDQYLVQAEENLTRNGCTVHWAETAEDARRIVGEIAKRHEVKSVVKGKSMLSEEVSLNPALEAMGIEVFETDLGEYIIQLISEPPSHIVGPAIHRSLEEVQILFNKHLGTPLDSDPNLLAAAARDVLRSAFLKADMGITGGNFLVAETGTLALIENEGNIRLTTSIPRIHVALVGIEKVLPRLDDLAGFFQLTARSATGQPIGMFTSLIQGPARHPDDDGPEEVHVVLVDNGRSRTLADPDAWEALRCVRCGACLNTCPVYRQTGGHAYGWVYSGPIGSVLDPGLLGLKEAMPLPFASTLCGACVDVCPVKIPITDLLLRWREKAVDQGLTSTVEGLGMKAMAKLSKHPRLFHSIAQAASKGAGALGSTLPLVSGWTEERAPLKRSPKSFRQLWDEGIES